jgi:DNA-binding winged helix-turn-helix (wHTH) protein/TolB-like protein/Tfp pilus assembly protein PilF
VIKSKRMNEIYKFGQFRVELVKRLLLRDQAPVPISNKAFDILIVLIKGRDRVLTKDELMEKVWPDTVVEENNLTVAMSGLRKALGEGSGDRRYIMTVPGRGYRFVAEVQTESLRASTGDRDRGIEAGAVADQHSRAEPASRPVTEAGRQEARVSAGQASRPRAWMFALAIVAVILGRAGYVVFTRIARPKTSVRSIHSIAVLPLKMMNASEDDRYLGVGMADALTAKLSNLSQLTVRPTGSVLRYGQTNANPVSAGKELSVDAVLDGEMQRSGNRIRVTVQLVSVRDGATLWADSSDEDFTNIFAMEDAISAALSEHLALRLTDAEKEVLTRHVTQNPEAYQAYMKGRYFWDKDTEEPMRKSIEYFEQAIELDPHFALAYVGIADAYSELVLQGYLPASSGLPKAKAAALAALQIDPTLAEPHNSLGVVAWGYDWDWKAADKEFARAADLNPESSATHSDRAFYFMTMKRFDESVAEAKRAVELNPASASLNTTVGYAYFASQRYEDSAAWLRKALDLDPNFSFPRAVLAADYALSGKSVEALAEYARIREVARTGNDPLVSAIAAHACAIAGDRSEALAILGALKSSSARRFVDPYNFAIVYSGLGDGDATFNWLERTLREHSLSVVFVNFDPFFLKFHSDARFMDLVRQANTPN